MGKEIRLITDLSALMLLFQSLTLSSKLHRRALRLMEYNMDVAGASHQLPDALPSLPLRDALGTDIDDSFPAHSSA